MAAASMTFASSSPYSLNQPASARVSKRAVTDRVQGSTDKPAPTTAVCPFCALLCDDLALNQRPDASFTVARNGCRRATAGYARAPLASEALIGGRSAPLDEAIGVAAKLLKRARQPLFGGLATDVDGIRACVNLAERCNAILDHVHGDALASMSRMLQARGWYATTLSEVRNRADLVVVIDVDVSQRYENFKRRCLDARPAPGGAPGKGREVVFIGAGKRAPEALGADTTISCRGENLVEVLLALLATLRGHRLAARRPAGAAASALADLAAKLREARYATFVFTPPRSPSTANPRWRPSATSSTNSIAARARPCLRSAATMADSRPSTPAPG